MELGPWWLPNLSVGASEIDIVGIKTSGKEAIVAEVKRQKRNYDHKNFMEKVERIKTSVLNNYDVEIRLYTIDDI